MVRNDCSGDAFVSVGQVIAGQESSKVHPVKENNCDTKQFSDKASSNSYLVSGAESELKSKPFDLYKRRTTAIVKRKTFLDISCKALAEYKYVSPNQRADLVLACR